MTATAAAPPPIGELAARSERLASRRLELLPLRGPDAAFTDVQGRGWGSDPTTSPADLADLISSIATVGLLQPVLVEVLPAGGGRRVVSGHRRLRAMRWGATNLADNPHFARLPANVVDGPLTDEEVRTWQLIENLARTDLRPGELAAALLYERCAVLAGELTDRTIDTTPAGNHDDPVARWEVLDRIRRDHDLHQVGAPWRTVVSRLGLELSPDRAKKLVAAFKAMPADLASAMDDHDITLASRMEWLRLHRGRQDAADQIWAAVKERGRPDLLTRSCQEARQHDGLDADGAIELAAAVHDEANDARAAASRCEPPPGLDGGHAADGELVATVRGVLAELAAALSDGATLDRYDAGSIRLHASTLIDAIDANGLDP